MNNNSQMWYVGKHPLTNISDSIDLDSSETYASSKSVSTLNKKINSYHDDESSLSNSNLPIGSILIYSGEFGGLRNRYPIDFVTKKPIYDWCLCDGGGTIMNYLKYQI